MADPKNEALPNALFFNVMRVRHTALEFFLDFGQHVLDQPGSISLVSPPLVTTPAHAKQILGALRDNIEKYEAKYGEIAVPSGATEKPGVPH
jgi:hypothetical protein